MPPQDVILAVARDQLVLDGGCTGKGMSWSIIASSPTSSNLAVFLAGFMVTAIAVMFVERSGEAPRHTLGLFASGVLVLGLDSYLFSSISARQPPMTDSHVTLMDSHVDIDAGGLAVCRGVWAQAMPAYGMLAAGSVALIGGISWMLIHYSTQSGAREPNKFLPFLGALLTFTITTGTTALVIQIAIDYLNMTRVSADSTSVPPPAPWMMWSMGTLFVVVTVLALVMITVRTVGMVGLIAARSQAQRDRTPLPPETRLRLIPLAAVLTALLALVGPIFAGFLIQRGVEVTTPLVVVVALTLGVFVPVGISLCVCYSVPGYGLTEFFDTVREWRSRRRRGRNSGTPTRSR